MIADTGASGSQKAKSVDFACERSQLRQIRSNNVPGGSQQTDRWQECSSSSSLEKCSFDFVSFLIYYPNTTARTSQMRLVKSSFIWSLITVDFFYKYLHYLIII